MAVDGTAVCDGCGATIYPDHLRNRTADRWAGKLLCPHCLAEKKAPPASAALGSIALQPEAPAARGAPAPEPTARVVTSAPAPREPTYRRALLDTPGLATRSRSFHAKLTDASLVHLNQQVNEWVDAHPDVSIKFATSSVGIIEGKHTDQHLVITIFY